MRPKQNITLTTLACARCGHTWFPRALALPEVCPFCKSHQWQTPPRAPKRSPRADLVLVLIGLLFVTAHASRSLAMFEIIDDFSDTAVGCVDDCLDPMPSPVSLPNTA